MILFLKVNNSSRQSLSRSHSYQLTNAAHFAYLHEFHITCLMHRHYPGMRKYVAAELVQATNNYTELIERGGFGQVYKGTYHHLVVAVKVLNEVIRVSVM